ncbi:MAG TPA: hypothetical protein VK623_04830, partial [Flavobacterium sp.]|nr:hypothetical protein [Flavobacterium sp.]
MKKGLISLLLLIAFSSCNISSYQLYNIDQTNGIDFSKGKWLIGEIEANPKYKDELSKLIFKDFTGYLGDRMHYALNETLLISGKTPFSPGKKQIKDLKNGTGYDFFINIKCKDTRSDDSNFEVIEHNYYLIQMSYALVTLEVYDLNKGTIVYTQTASGRIDEDNSISFRPSYN